MKFKKDYYQVLGVSPGASALEIRRAYRRLAILYHPDRNPSPQATLRMQEINEAYTILGDKRKRIKYDLEHGNFWTEAQSTSASPGRATNLQQVSAEDAARRIRFQPLVIALAVLMISTYIFSTNAPPFWWSMPPSRWWWWLEAFWDTQKLTFFAFYTAILSLVSSGVIFLQILSKFQEFEMQCPKCGKDRAAKKVNEELIGILQRSRIHYQCKYCFYEWYFIETKR